ncbi:fused MFS/spermidine synthase, partial [bacterium]|nr:fused MFS/spermidine synthase [bacterium]
MRKHTLALFLFALSGFAGLAYEMAWIRRAALVFGSSTWALSTVLAVFFGGLALGSWAFGRRAPRVARPLRWYALLEAGLAVLAVASLFAFDLVEGIFGAAYRSGLAPRSGADGLPWLAAGPGVAWLRFALVAAVLVPPTFLMGGTLPLFVRRFVADARDFVPRLGLVYGLNTLGGVAGVLAAGFVLIPDLGVTATVLVAAGVNLVVAAVAWPLGREALPVDGPASAAGDGADADERALPLTTAGRRVVVPLLFFATGLVVVGAEVLWARFLGLVLRNSVTTAAVTLAVVLGGIVLGSLLVGRLTRGTAGDRRLPLLFGIFQLAAAVAVIATMFLPAALWFGLGPGAGPFFLLMLPASLLSGASFPLANRLALRDPARSAESVGRMTALNTVGGITGSLLAGFVLLPGPGLEVGVRVLTAGGLVAAAAALLLLEPLTPRARLGRGLAVAVGACLWLLLPRATGVHLPDSFLARDGVLVDSVEGQSATLSVVDVEGERQLEIDNLWQGVAGKGHQIMAAHLPALLHPAPRDILVIGVGVGQTAGRFLRHDPASLDCVDIEPALFPFIDRHFPNDWLRDRRVRLVAEDGRTFTAHTDRSYDIVSVEVGQTFRPGVDVFYTREFYADVRARLNPGGLVAQFVPLGFLPEAAFRAVLATFLAEFPDAALWYNTQELLLVGGREGVPRLDPVRLRAVEAGRPGAVTTDLRWSHWGGERHHLRHPGALVGGFLAGGEALAALAAGGEIYGDDRPVLAYATRGADILDHNEAPMARVIAGHLSPLANAVTGRLTPEEAALAEETRGLNLRDIVAAGIVAQVT